MKKFSIYEVYNEMPERSYNEKEMINGMTIDGTFCESYDTFGEAMVRVAGMNGNVLYCNSFEGHGGVKYRSVRGFQIWEEEEDEDGEIIGNSELVFESEMLKYRVCLEVISSNGAVSPYENYEVDEWGYEDIVHDDFSWLEPDNGYWFYRNEDTGEEIIGYQNHAE